MRRLSLVALLWGCASPLPVERRDYVLGQIASRYHEFYPAQGDPDLTRDVGLLEPRFGLPAMVKAGTPFEVALLEHGQPPAPVLQLCREKSCWPVTLSERKSVAVVAGFEEARYSAQSAAPPGAYDLVMESKVDAPVRVPRAVWLRAEDPQSVRVVQLNDLHIGKGVSHLEDHIRQVIYDINQLHPDVVLVTGDLVNIGTDVSQPPRAQMILLAIEAPVVAIVGNHDLGFDSFTRVEYGTGWSNFARSFHSSLELRFVLGGWRFIGFDSGPSTFSPRIETRGLLPPAVAALGAEIAQAAADKLRGVILFSHAPTRSAITGDGPGAFGKMKWGSKELERLMLDAPLRVMHLSGHTHWSDLFEEKAGKFVRWRKLSPCMKPIDGKAALINTQAAGHAGVSFKESAYGWGFTELLLDGGVPRVAFHRYGLPDDPWQCAASDGGRGSSPATPAAR